MRLMQNVHGRYFMRQERGFTIRPDMVDSYLDALRKAKRARGTIDSYRLYLKQLYHFLPEDKCIRSDTLERWRELLHSRGYTARTINVHLSAANSFLRHYGRRDLQLDCQLPIEKPVLPELSRTEYLRLLQAAKQLGKERLYLLIKLFGTTGMPVNGLSDVTVEAVEDGVIPLGENKEGIRLPACLRQELLNYARRQGIRSGKVFLTRAGKSLSRTNVTDAIRHLCRDAQVPEEKGSPRCLRHMYQQTRKEMLQNISTLLDQQYERLLESEQIAAGWAAG